MPRGGKREGAGRPRGRGPWQEPTRPLRIPISLLNDVRRFVETRGYAMPMYSSRVPAGTPDTEDDHIERITDLNSLLLRNPADTFILRVIGDSMIDVGIYENDLLTVDRRLEAQSGHIVVAMVNGDATVKVLRRSADGITLIPKNKKYLPIKIGPEDDFQVLGVVTNVIRNVLSV